MALQHRCWNYRIVYRHSGRPVVQIRCCCQVKRDDYSSANHPAPLILFPSIQQTDPLPTISFCHADWSKYYSILCRQDIFCIDPIFASGTLQNHYRKYSDPFQPRRFVVRNLVLVVSGISFVTSILNYSVTQDLSSSPAAAHAVFSS